MTLRHFVLGLATCATLASGCAKKIAPDARIDSTTGHFKIGEWPPKATTFAETIIEIEGRIGPGIKRSNGMVEWLAPVDEEHCARIQVSEAGGKVSAENETLKKRHPDFDACMAGK